MSSSIIELVPWNKVYPEQLITDERSPESAAAGRESDQAHPDLVFAILLAQMVLCGLAAYVGSMSLGLVLVAGQAAMAGIGIICLFLPVQRLGWLLVRLGAGPLIPLALVPNFWWFLA